MMKLNSNHMGIKSMLTHHSIFRFQEEILFHLNAWSIVA